MQKNASASRRHFFKKLAIGFAGTAAASSTVAQVCTQATSAQPLGPFFPRPGTPIDAVKEDGTQPIYLANDNDLTFINGRNGKATGQEVNISGFLTDKNCNPVSNATIIIWQASKTGRYNHTGDAVNEDFDHPITEATIERRLDPYFQSWGQTTTDAQGYYEFRTIIPGFYPADLNTGWYRPPHIHFLVSAMGHEQFVTQMYFRGDEVEDNAFIQELNQKDLLLQSENLSEPDRQKLIVDFVPSLWGDDTLIGQFDIVLP